MRQFWQIYGADAHTGADINITVEAADEQEATEAARIRGVFVSSLRKTVPSASTSTDDRQILSSARTSVSSSLRSVAAIVGIFVLSAVVCLSLYLFLTRDNFERDNRARIIALRDEARKQQIAGKTELAVRSYDELLTLIGNRQIRDSAIGEALIDARAGRDGLQKRLYAAEQDAAQQRMLAEEREKAAEQKRLASLRLQTSRPKENPAIVQPSVTGAAWITLRSGDSTILRGLLVHVIHQKVPTDKELQALGQTSQVLGNMLAATWLEKGNAATARAKEETEFAKRNEGNERLSKTGTELAMAFNAQAAAYSALVQEHKNVSESFTAILDEPREDAQLDVKALYAKIRNSQHVFAKGLKFNRLVGASLVGDVNRMSMTNFEVEPMWPLVLKKASIANGSTNVDGKFRIVGIKPGSYYLYALHLTSGFAVEWMIPFKAMSSSNVVVDLHNGNAVGTWNLDPT